jgi:phage terminase large subunit-like protein
VLADASGQYSPDGWARKAVELFRSLKADRFVAEGNQGGEMVRHTIQSVWPSAPITIVHASRGKYARAEPIAALYEQDRISHAGNFTELEDQMTTWEPLGDKPSPDRLDAMVWGFTNLMLDSDGMPQFGSY